MQKQFFSPKHGFPREQKSLVRFQK